MTLWEIKKKQPNPANPFTIEDRRFQISLVWKNNYIQHQILSILDTFFKWMSICPCSKMKLTLICFQTSFMLLSLVVSFLTLRINDKFPDRKLRIKLDWNNYFHTEHQHFQTFEHTYQYIGHWHPDLHLYLSVFF